MLCATFSVATKAKKNNIKIFGEIAVQDFQLYAHKIYIHTIVYVHIYNVIPLNEII